MISTIRHIEVFDPEQHPGRIDIIGAGATGSKVALELAKLGLTDIHVWDDDDVAEHNIANQAYRIDHIGKPKVGALYEIIKASTGTEITIHCQKCDGSEEFGETVFLLTDTMESRKAIFEGAIKMKMRTKLMVETRMGVDDMRVYAINPVDVAHVDGWEETLYDDDVAEVSACGASISVGATATTLAGIAVWTFIAWHTGGDVDNETIMSLRPISAIARKFEFSLV